MITTNSVNSVDMDENAKDCMNDDAVIHGVWSFADKYQAFMTDRFAGNQPHSMNQGVIYSKNKLLAALSTDVANAAKIPNIPQGELTSWQKRLANMQDANRAWEVSITFVWAGPTTSKRDTDSLSCDRPNPSLTTESTIEPTTDSTTFATSVRTSSDITTTSEEDVTSTTQQAIDTEKVGLWTSIHVFHKVGNCKLGTASQTQPPVPGGCGGAIVGTIVSGQDFEDQLQVRHLL